MKNCKTCCFSKKHILPFKKYCRNKKDYVNEDDLCEKYKKRRKK